MEIKNLALIKGREAKIEKGHIKITAPNKIKKGDKETIEERHSLEVRSDFLFSNGSIEFKFKTNNFNTGILFLFNCTSNQGVVIGLSKTYDAFIIGDSIGNFKPISLAGSFKNYPLNQEHHCKIEVNGSFAKLFVNGVMLCENIVSIKESILSIRFNSDGELEIYDIKVHAVKPKIFIVMQFTKEYNELFEDVIKPITEQAGFECIRADEFYTSTPIIKDIIESIQDSAAIIAEITPDNPNVFYEIGYSHAINKPTILLCDRKREKLPFDISSFRTLFYENTIAGKKKVEESLKKYLQNIK
jgi:hypothetical protein